MAHRYDPTRTAASAAVTEDEVAALLRSDLSSVVRDSDTLRLLLGRFGATLRGHQREMRQLRGDIDRIALESKAAKAPMAAAITALGKLSVDEQRQVLDVHASALLADLRSATADARRVKLAATSEGNRVRLVLSQLLDDVDGPTRTRVEAALAALPASGALPLDPPPVDVDTILEPGTTGFTLPAAAAPEAAPGKLAALFD